MKFENHSLWSIVNQCTYATPPHRLTILSPLVSQIFMISSSAKQCRHCKNCYVLLHSSWLLLILACRLQFILSISGLFSISIQTSLSKPDDLQISSTMFVLLFLPNYFVMMVLSNPCAKFWCMHNICVSFVHLYQITYIWHDIYCVPPYLW